MINYYAPKKVWDRLKDKTIPKNGCGSKFTYWIVPDKFCCLGLNLTIPCAIHDEQYALGKTNEDKIEADRIFRNNGYRAVEAMPKLFRPIGRIIVDGYVSSVSGGLGNVAFWRDKNNPEEMTSAVVESVADGIKIVRTIKGIL